MKNNLTLVYVTATNKDEAVKIGEEVVSMRLAACANVIENMTAIYWWENKIETSDEVVLILKTKESLLSELEETVKKLHSYSCPCIVAIPLLCASEDYAGWILKETK
ncbi:MAG: divalent-cation tolerance protein CutA [Candidatus Omnitrophica bacterium]|nr:divalent-cation tolerance protein CutA [Candidatus Omnitrophota bacterium]